MFQRAHSFDLGVPVGISGMARALLALVATLALLASQAVTAFHFAFVPHHLCREHGALEDGAAADAAAHDAAESTPVAVAATAGADDAHEVCMAFALSKQGGVLPQAATLPVVMGGEVVLLERRGEDVKPDRAGLLSLAPKLSPPSVG